jgi:hypothetical protein
MPPLPGPRRRRGVRGAAMGALSWARRLCSTRHNPYGIRAHYAHAMAVQEPRPSMGRVFSGSAAAEAGLMPGAAGARIASGYGLAEWLAGRGPVAQRGGPTLRPLVGSLNL